MATFISKGGVWTPAKERAVNPNAPEGQEIYEGPDRDALKILRDQNVESLGIHFSKDPELVLRARQHGFSNVQEYLEAHGYDEEKAKAQEAINEKTIADHKPPKPQKPVNMPSGGQDTTGSGKSMKGGIGDYQDELKKVS